MDVVSFERFLQTSATFRFLKTKDFFSWEIKGKPTELEQEKENALMVINFIRFIERINLSNAFYQSNF